MSRAGPAHVLLCADDASAVGDLRTALEDEGLAVSCQPLSGVETDGPPPCDLIMLDGSRAGGEALHLCRRFRAGLGEVFVPILYVTADPDPAARLTSLENGADACLPRPFSSHELLAQVRAFLRIKQQQDRLMERTSEIHRTNQRLQRSHQQLDQELELARRIQQSLLPQSLPELPAVEFAVHYRPCGQVGGDFYDVFRLDESHVGCYVADAMGHGVPASLLTIFIKKGVKAKEIFGKDYRLVPPDEVLQRLNRDLIEQHLAEQPFITMVYALYNFRSGVFQFARAGHPYPIHIPANGEPVTCQVPGTLLGVFETQFQCGRVQLQPGDKLVLYTDGAETAAVNGKPAGVESLLAGLARHRNLSIHELVDHLTWDLFRHADHVDDWTILGLEAKA